MYIEKNCMLLVVFFVIWYALSLYIHFVCGNEKKQIYLEEFFSNMFRPALTKDYFWRNKKHYVTIRQLNPN